MLCLSLTVVGVSLSMKTRSSSWVWRPHTDLYWSAETEAPQMPRRRRRKTRANPARLRTPVTRSLQCNGCPLALHCEASNATNSRSASCMRRVMTFCNNRSTAAATSNNVACTDRSQSVTPMRSEEARLRKPAKPALLDFYAGT